MWWIIFIPNFYAICNLGQRDKDVYLPSIKMASQLNGIEHPGCKYVRSWYKIINGFVAQLNRASDYGSEGYRFESYRGHKGDYFSVISFFLQTVETFI